MVAASFTGLVAGRSSGRVLLLHVVGGLAPSSEFGSLSLMTRSYVEC
jgi:hypothetical protein